MMLDKWTPYTTSRWVFTVVLVIAFMARILLAQVQYSTVQQTVTEIHLAGLVHRHLRSSHLPSEPPASISHS